MNFADIQAVIYRDADGKVITLGGDSTGGGLTQAEVEQLIAEAELTDLADTPNALGTAGQILAVSSDGTETVWIDQPTGGGGGTGDVLRTELKDYTLVANTDKIPVQDIAGTSDLPLRTFNISGLPINDTLLPTKYIPRL